MLYRHDRSKSSKDRKNSRRTQHRGRQKRCKPEKTAVCFALSLTKNHVSLALRNPVRWARTLFEFRTANSPDADAPKQQCRHKVLSLADPIGHPVGVRREDERRRLIV